MLSPTKAEASVRFLDWLEKADGEGRVFLSVVAVHEIERGIELLETKGATAKASRLRFWLTGLLAAYDEKILRLDIEAASFAGRLEARALSAGHSRGMTDAVVAGIAKARDLGVITRNLKHFEPFDVRVFSPDEVEGGAAP